MRTANCNLLKVGSAGGMAKKVDDDIGQPGIVLGPAVGMVIASGLTAGTYEKMHAKGEISEVGHRSHAKQGLGTGDIYNPMKIFIGNASAKGEENEGLHPPSEQEETVGRRLAIPPAGICAAIMESAVGGHRTMMTE